MKVFAQLFAPIVKSALIIGGFLLVGCGKPSEPVPNGENPATTKPTVKEGDVRTTLEVWCDEPVTLSFWFCSWLGVLSYNGKTYGSERTISLMQDLGKQQTTGGYYKTEFEAITSPDYLGINVWVSLPEGVSPHSFKVTLKSRTYVNGRLDEKYNVDKKDFQVGLLGQGFQFGKSLEVNS